MAKAAGDYVNVSRSGEEALVVGVVSSDGDITEEGTRPIGGYFVVCIC